MAKYPGFVQRGKRCTYWFRRRAPAHSNLPEINLSLRTSDFDQAVEQWVGEDAKARKLFANGAIGSVPATWIGHAEIVTAFKRDLEKAEIDYRIKRSMLEGEKPSPKWPELAQGYRKRLRCESASA